MGIAVYMQVQKELHAIYQEDSTRLDFLRTIQLLYYDLLQDTVLLIIMPED